MTDPDIMAKAREMRAGLEGVTKGPWAAGVVLASVGLRTSGYLHQVFIGLNAAVVGHSEHQNYERIETIPLGNGYVRETGIGRLEPDLTPNPTAQHLARCDPDTIRALLDTLDTALAERARSEARIKALEEGPRGIAAQPVHSGYAACQNIALSLLEQPHDL